VVSIKWEEFKKGVTTGELYQNRLIFGKEAPSHAPPGKKWGGKMVERGFQKSKKGGRISAWGRKNLPPEIDRQEGENLLRKGKRLKKGQKIRRQVFQRARLLNFPYRSLPMNGE